MKLSEALILRLSYNDLKGEIKVDENGYICLNDLAAYYPQKRIDNWKRLDSTSEFISTVEKHLNTSQVSKIKPVISKRGKYKGGTYAHELVAMEFCTWLSPEFKLKVYLEYMQGTQRKENWNIKRILASENYKLMSQSVENAHDPVRGYHYGNEAKMLNKIVFGMHQKGIRDVAGEEQLNDIAWLESKNSAYIDIKMSYDERRIILSDLYQKRNKKRVEDDNKNIKKIN